MLEVMVLLRKRSDGMAPPYDAIVEDWFASPEVRLPAMAGDR